MYKKNHQLRLLWTRSARVHPDEPNFPKLLFDCSPRDLPPVSTGTSELHTATRKNLYKSCLKIIIGVSPLNGVSRWKRLPPAGPPSEPVWESMYFKPIAKRTGDLQWHLAHWIIPCNTYVRNFAPISACCPFCSVNEDVFFFY